MNAGVCAGADSWIQGAGAELPSINPATNEVIAAVTQATAADYDAAVAAAQVGFEEWRTLPAPKRGEVIRDLGNALREYKEPLGELVTLENGKIPHRRFGRSAGDDRYLRFRRRLVAATLRFDDALGAPGASHVRAMASAGTDRHHYSLSTFR